MNKIPCNVIRDLLVLHEDNVCSEESRQIIEEHIAECEECKELYEKTKKELPVKDALDESMEILSEAFKKLQRKLTTKRLILGGLITLSVFAAYIAWGFLQDWVNIVPSKDIQVTELYELENGDIYCTLQTERPFFTVSMGEIIVPDGDRTKDSDKGIHKIHLQYPFPFKAYNNWIGDTNTLRIGERNTISLIFPVVDRQPRGTVYNSSDPDLRTHTCKTIYYNGSPDDKLVIWEDGWSIEPAPEALEKKVAQYMEEWEEWGNPYSEQDATGENMAKSSYPHFLWTNTWE